MAKKKREKTVEITHHSINKHKKSLQNFVQIYKSLEPWIPWIIGGLYAIVMSYLTFRYHTVGGLDVETDFYAELFPQAKKLVDGEFSPLNYSAKGPVYSIFLAAMYLFSRDYFIAAEILNLFSSAVFIAILYNLIKNVFNSLTALIVTLIVLSNYMFQNFTYQVGSDMPFMAFCALSMYYLFKNNGISKRDIALSAFFGLLAFLTRYNGVFIVFGTVLFLALNSSPLRERAKRITLWLGVFIVVGLPWFIPNTMATGNPVHNNNYINIMLEFYGHGPDGLQYENWIEALPKQFTGLGDIFFYNPVYFVKKMAINIAGHFIWDMRALVQWRFSVFIFTGLILLWFAKPSRRLLLYFSFGLIYFLILTLVFYNARFSLFLLMFYAPLAVWPLTSDKISEKLGRLSFVPVSLLLLVTLTITFTSTRMMLDDIKYVPYFLKDMGEALDTREPDKSKKLLARKPHAAYYAGLVPSMFPDDVQNVDQLVAFCRKYKVDYVLYSLVEAKYRPQLQDLLNLNKKHSGLEMIYSNMFGAVYYVKPVK
ncbi:MAG: glycosyltransferase family 39 protein [Candidatus Latescibacteria bacterium]|nr:glycosyltransferase family 39 protein [Candidatus Latescibacterota bacterium]